MTMKCPKCKEDITNDFLVVYKLGLQDGSNQYQKHLNRIEKTFKALFKELGVMDLRTPDKVNCVYLSRKMVEKVCSAFEKCGKYHWSNKLREITKEQLSSTLSVEAKLREMLENLQE